VRCTASWPRSRQPNRFAFSALIGDTSCTRPGLNRGGMRPGMQGFGASRTMDATLAAPRCRRHFARCSRSAQRRCRRRAAESRRRGSGTPQGLVAERSAASSACSCRHRHAPPRGCGSAWPRPAAAPASCGAHEDAEGASAYVARCGAPRVDRAEVAAATLAWTTRCRAGCSAARRSTRSRVRGRAVGDVALSWSHGAATPLTGSAALPAIAGRGPHAGRVAASAAHRNGERGGAAHGSGSTTGSLTTDQPVGGCTSGHGGEKAQTCPSSQGRADAARGGMGGVRPRIACNARQRLHA